MSVTVFEEVPGSTVTKDGIAGDGDSFKAKFRAFSDYAGTSSAITDARRADIGLAIPSYIPSTRLGLPLAEVEVNEMIAPGWFEIDVEYSKNKQRQHEKNDDKDAGESSWSFEISTTTQKIRMSEELLEKKGVAPGVLAYPAPLGFDGKKVNGVDILVPEASWEETYFFPSVSQANRVQWLKLVGSINIATFKGAAIGEALLASVNGKRSGSEPWEVSFKFLYSPNRTSLDFKLFDAGAYSTVNFASVGGWDVFDFIYHEQIEGGDLVIWPKAITRHRVYPLGDFSLLGIGV